MNEIKPKRKPFKSPRLTTEKKEQIISLYQNGVGPLRISKTLNITSKTVYNHLNKNGLRNNTTTGAIRRLYIVNEDYFYNVDTEEKIYWIGFLTAHATISKDNRFILIETSSKDLEHLQKFLGAIGSTYPIHNKLVNGYPIYYVKIYSRKLISDMHRFDVHLGKQDNMRWPNLIPRWLYTHYIRGYFDGHGFWGLYPGKNIYVFSIRSASQEYINAIVKILEEECHLNEAEIVAKKSCFKVQFNGKLQTHRIYQYLYSGATIYLQRKFEKAQKALGHVTAKVLLGELN